MTPPLVVSCGGGLNSAAMLVGLQERGIVPDLILFADTGGEKPETYEFNLTLNAWCLSVGFPEIITVKKAGFRVTTQYRDLESNCLVMKMLPSIAYGFKSCSHKYKKEPQDKYVNHWEPARATWAEGLKVRKAIGFDAGERRRAGIPDDAKYTYWYPLLAWGWFREDCVAAVKRAGLPVPCKSACFFCPSSKKTEVIALSNEHPDLFARAVEMEDNSRENWQTIKGLGRHWSWKELVQIETTKREALVDPPQIACMCFDGDPDE